MNQEKINSLKEKFFQLFPSGENAGLNADDIKHIEEILKIYLPKDFVSIARFFDGNNGIIFNNMYSFNPANVDWNICDQTIKLRKSVNLPHNLLVLAEPDEGVVLMEIVSGNEFSSKVYWLGIGDAHNLIEGKSLEDNPTIFSSFTDFFAYLLNEEEKRRAEEKSL
jgi:hypothetical protein